METVQILWVTFIFDQSSQQFDFSIVFPVVLQYIIGFSSFKKERRSTSCNPFLKHCKQLIIFMPQQPNFQEIFEIPPFPFKKRVMPCYEIPTCMGPLIGPLQSLHGNITETASIGEILGLSDQKCVLIVFRFVGTYHHASKLHFAIAKAPILECGDWQKRESAALCVEHPPCQARPPKPNSHLR